MAETFSLYANQDCHLQFSNDYPELIGGHFISLKMFEDHGAITDPFYLYAGQNGLELWKLGDKRGVWIDERKVMARATYASDLAKACGLLPSQQPKVLDLMAGFGVDGVTLALLGAEVESVEVLPGIALMAQELGYRCGLCDWQVRCQDSWQLLNTKLVDVVYLDPMFELDKRNALAGKRMQYLESLGACSQHSVAEWIDLALSSARNRVVVKRHIRDRVEQKPDWQIVGKRVRFDVYRGQSPVT